MERAILNTRLLRGIPIFSGLSDEELNKILSSPLNARVQFDQGTTIIEEHDPGDCMYVILSGTVDITIRAVDGREVSIGTMHAGEYFGEQALFPGTSGRRNASIRAIKPCELFRISKQHALKGIRTNTALGPTPEQLANASREERIWLFLRGMRLFRGCDSEAFSQSKQSFELVHCEPGQVIIREGDEARHLFVILEGMVEIFVIDDDGKIAVLWKIGLGSYFGEQALLPGNDKLRNINARADGEATLIQIDKDFFLRILAQDPKLKTALKTVSKAEQKKIQSIRGKVRHI
jgi:CRP-like cAMP-binding protein